MFSLSFGYFHLLDKMMFINHNLALICLLLDPVIVKYGESWSFLSWLTNKVPVAFEATGWFFFLSVNVCLVSEWMNHKPGSLTLNFPLGFTLKIQNLLNRPHYWFFRLPKPIVPQTDIKATSFVLFVYNNTAPNCHHQKPDHCSSCWLCLYIAELHWFPEIC